MFTGERDAAYPIGLGHGVRQGKGRPGVSRPAAAALPMESPHCRCKANMDCLQRVGPNHLGLWSAQGSNSAFWLCVQGLQLLTTHIDSEVAVRHRLCLQSFRCLWWRFAPCFRCRWRLRHRLLPFGARRCSTSGRHSVHAANMDCPSIYWP